MIIGHRIHAEKEQTFLEKAEETTWEQFLASEKLTITKEIYLDWKIGDIKLVGKVDEIAVDAQKIQVIDDKPKAYPYDSVKSQIFAYCYLFKESFKPLQKTLIATLRDRDTNKLIWQQEFNKESEEKFFIKFHRLRAVLLKKEEPISTKNQKKCQACQFKDSCKFSLVNKL